MQTPGIGQMIVQRIRARETPPNWSLLLALFFILAFVILWIAGQFIAATLSGDFNSTLAVGALIGCVIVSAVIVHWARRRMPDHWIEELRLRQPKRPPVYAVVLVGLGAAWAIDLIGVLLKIQGTQVVPPVVDVLRGPVNGTWIVAAILAIFAQPIAEGLIFCGLLYPALARDLGNNLLACIGVAVVYTLVSAAILSTGAEPWYLLVQPFLMLLVVALVRMYTQSTQSAIVARTLFGLFFVLAALLSLRF